MKVLLIGSGGREHAIAYKLKQSPLLSQLKVYPGNGGFTTEELLPSNCMNLKDKESVQNLIRQEKFDLVVVGPEEPLVDGIADWLAEIGVDCFGPSAYCAGLEGSKEFAKKIMAQAGVPTAKYGYFTSYESAAAYVEEQGVPIVIKADGLAAGKGVSVCESKPQAIAALEDIFHKQKFGQKNQSVVIEELMRGEEASIFAITDGENFLTFPAAQDHKRAYEQDTGPNTGGMGAYVPTPMVTESLEKKVQDCIIRPMIKHLKASGHPYCGLLYAGLMMDDQQNPRVVEFNCRFGDPETQAIFMLLESDLLELMLAACQGNIGGKQIQWSDDSASVVVLAAKGYPGSYPKDIVLQLPESTSADTVVFHAGTRQENGQILSNGGRILAVASRGKNLSESLTKNYSYLQLIATDDTFYRKDIGFKALK